MSKASDLLYKLAINAAMFLPAYKNIKLNQPGAFIKAQPKENSDILIQLSSDDIKHPLNNKDMGFVAKIADYNYCKANNLIEERELKDLMEKFDKKNNLK